MKIYLDDQRTPPEGWILLRNLNEVEQFMKIASREENFFIDTMSFDFHLSHPKNGVDVMKYLVNLCCQHNTKRFWPKTVLYHSDDPEGVKAMEAFAASLERGF